MAQPLFRCAGFHAGLTSLGTCDVRVRTHFPTPPHPYGMSCGTKSHHFTSPEGSGTREWPALQKVIDRQLVLEYTSRNCVLSNLARWQHEVVVLCRWSAGIPADQSLAAVEQKRTPVPSQWTWWHPKHPPKRLWPTFPLPTLTPCVDSCSFLHAVSGTGENPIRNDRRSEHPVVEYWLARE